MLDNLLNFGTDPDADPALFVSDLQKFLCLFHFEGTFISFFKDKKSQRSHKQ
jgi:hypothetical protein